MNIENVKLSSKEVLKSNFRLYGQMEKAEVGRVREEKRRREKIREEKWSEERRCRCEKRYESRETLFVSNDLWLQGVEKQTR